MKLTIKLTRRRPARKSKVTLKKMLSKMKGRNPYGEIDIGGPVGRELF